MPINKVTLALNKPAYIGMCILELSKVLMYQFHYDYIKNKCDNKSKLLFTDTDSLTYEINTEDVYEDFSRNKEIFDLSNYSTKSKYHNDSNKLVIKDETAGVSIEEFFGLKPKIYLYLVGDNSEHKKTKGVIINTVATIRHNEHNDVLVNKKCLRHSMNRIQSKDHEIGIYKISMISLSSFDDKIYIQSNGCDRLALGY